MYTCYRASLNALIVLPDRWPNHEQYHHKYLWWFGPMVKIATSICGDLDMWWKPPQKSPHGAKITTYPFHSEGVGLNVLNWSPCASRLLTMEHLLEWISITIEYGVPWTDRLTTEEWAKAVTTGHLLISLSAAPTTKLLHIYIRTSRLWDGFSPLTHFLPPQKHLSTSRKPSNSLSTNILTYGSHRIVPRNRCPATLRYDCWLRQRDCLCDPPLWLYHHLGRWSEWEQILLFFKPHCTVHLLLQVRLIWPGPLTFPKLLYYINRYLSIAMSLYCVSASFLPPPKAEYFGAMFDINVRNFSPNYKNPWFTGSHQMFVLLIFI